MQTELPAGAECVSIRPPQEARNTSGQAILLPETIGVVAPFRYVEVEGLPDGLTQECFVQQRFEYPFDEDAADFECSDAVLSAVWDLCKYSIRATTFCGVYVDGDRERIPYEADAYINQLSHYGVDREYALARRSHEYLLAHPTWPTEWKQHSVLMAWEDYQYTGDAESLAEHYPTLRDQKLLTSAEPYRDIVDWNTGERDGYQLRPVNTVVNAFHHATLRRMADVARVMGRSDEADAMSSKTDAFAECFNQRLWDQERRR